ncbi:MAG TPA: hypothetical protein VKB18_00230 [Gemmatimonadota bacterium]|nr:hypothetical protein [Gemmatimonadota bacterium]
MLDSIALALSGLAVAVLLAFATDCMRREPDHLPLAGRVPRALAGRPLRWLWIAALAASFVGGLYGIPLRERRDVREGEAEAAGPPGRETRRTLRLPFYVHVETVTTATDGSFLGSTRSTRTQIPWAFLAVAGIYAAGVAGGGGATGDRAPLTPPSAGTGARR